MTVGATAVAVRLLCFLIRCLELVFDIDSVSFVGGGGQNILTLLLLAGAMSNELSKARSNIKRICADAD